MEWYVPWHTNNTPSYNINSKVYLTTRVSNLFTQLWIQDLYLLCIPVSKGVYTLLCIQDLYTMNPKVYLSTRVSIPCSVYRTCILWTLRLPVYKGVYTLLCIQDLYTMDPKVYLSTRVSIPCSVSKTCILWTLRYTCLQGCLYPALYLRLVCCVPQGLNLQHQHKILCYLHSLLRYIYIYCLFEPNLIIIWICT